MYDEHEPRRGYETNTSQLDGLDFYLKRAADPGSYRYVRGPQATALELSIGGQELRVTANLGLAEEEDQHIKRLVDESPAYRDTVLVLTYFLHTRGLMGHGKDRISPFVLSLVVHFCFQVRDGNPFPKSRY